MTNQLHTAEKIINDVGELVANAINGMVGAPPTIEQVRDGLRANGYDVNAYDIEFDANMRNVLLTPKCIARDIKFTIGFSDESK